MSSWKGKSRGGFLGHLFFVFILKYLGLTVAYFFLRFVALYFLFFTPKAFKAIFYLNNKLLGFGVVRSIFNVYLNFYKFGQILVDKATMFSGFHENFEHTSIGMENIKEIVDGNRGGVLITSHFGGWQSAVFFLKDTGIKPRLLMVEEEHDKIKQLFKKMPHADSMDTIPMSNNLSHIFEVAKTLRNGNLISIQGDRTLEGSKNIRVRFLGQEADFPAGPFAVIARFDVPVTFIFAVKTGKTQYKCTASPVIRLSDHPELKKKEEKEKFLVKQYARILEEYVLEYPEQWFNYYDFWQ
ncbi:lysophospholipid acyltransferase family protein [bacterium]|nr:lysophospholipid acyltransferase family protein [bacterium]